MGEGDPTDDQPGQAETGDGGEDYDEWGNPELALTTVEAIGSSSVPEQVDEENDEDEWGGPGITRPALIHPTVPPDAGASTPEFSEGASSREPTMLERARVRQLILRDTGMQTRHA